MKKILIRMFYKLPFSYATKMKILKFRRSIIGYKEIKDNSVGVVNNNELKNEYIEQVLNTPSVGPESDTYVPLSDRKYVRQDIDPKLFAFYLTQYHPTKENDEWWGKGTTEWNNVTRAVPQFVGHYQPRIPDELGYYDLRIKDNMRRQIELAKQYGVYGFCFYHYWFDGRRILEKPLNMFLEDKTLDFPFMYCWANHSWYKKFQGTSDEILIEMPKEKDSYIRYIEAVLPDMHDERYYKIDGKPVLIVYRPSDIPEVKDVLNIWRSKADRDGFNGLYLIAVHEGAVSDDYRKKGFDASSEFQPTTFSALLSKVDYKTEVVNSKFSGTIYDYKKIVKKQIFNQYSAPMLYKSVMAFWDNTARKNSRGNIYTNIHPDFYEEWLTDLIEYNKRNKQLDDNLIFVNAWNEWGEGAYLEPDRKYGYALLERTRDAIEKARNKAVNQ